MPAFIDLERASDLLEQGRPDRAASLLRGPVPGPFRLERDFLLAESLRRQGYFSRCEVLYKRVLAGRDEELWRGAAAGLTSVLRSLGRTREARALWKQARRRARRDDLPALTLEDALIDRAGGAYPTALRKLAPILRGALKGRDWGLAAFVLWATGGARRFSGDLEGARADFARSLSLARRAGDPEGQAYALFGLGGVLRILGRFPEAERAYAEAGRRLAGTPDLFGRAYAHCGLANVLRQRGRLAEAERHYGLSHKLYSSLGDKVDLAYVDWGLGQVHYKRGELPRAERRTRLALAGFSAGGEERGLVISEKALAEILHARGRTPEAEKLFDRAVARARKAGLHAHLETYT